MFLGCVTGTVLSYGVRHDPLPNTNLNIKVACHLSVGQCCM